MIIEVTEAERDMIVNALRRQGTELQEVISDLKRDVFWALHSTDPEKTSQLDSSQELLKSAEQGHAQNSALVERLTF